MARILDTSSASIRAAGKKLQSGGLVAFPTETVYGLGANALDEAAVISIFQAKGRPLSDPVIVHVPSTEVGVGLLDLDDTAASLFTALASEFWPGPLTLIGRATAALPSCVSAGTGFVGIRRPAHPVAQALLEEAGVPVAAPSANRFGHVSPTTPEHVMHDLGGHDILVLDAGSTGACAVGIESTVVRVEAGGKAVTIFRRGGVSEAQLRRALEQHCPGTAVFLRNAAAQPADGAQCAPGQLLTHYAPDVATYLALPAAAESGAGADAGADAAVPAVTLDDGTALDVAGAVLVDIGGQLRRLAAHALAYRDLSAAGDVAEAARGLFAALRWAEAERGATAVVLAPVRGGEAIEGSDAVAESEHAGALFDRMFRAASGRRCRV